MPSYNDEKIGAANLEDIQKMIIYGYEDILENNHQLCSEEFILELEINSRELKYKSFMMEIGGARAEQTGLVPCGSCRLILICAMMGDDESL